MKKEDILQFLADDYTDKRQLNYSAMCSLMMELSLSMKKDFKVLDLACGTGRILIPLAKMFPTAKFWAFDASKEMLDQLRVQLVKNKINNVVIIKGDFNDNGWQELLHEKSFDLVILFQAVHFVKTIDHLFGTIYNLLKKKGRLILASTSHDQFYRLPYCQLFKTVLARELRRTPDKIELINRLHKHDFEILNTINILVERGFVTEMELESWLRERPFSALAYLSTRLFEDGVGESVEYFKKQKKYIVDEFSVMTFEKDAI